MNVIRNLKPWQLITLFAVAHALIFLLVFNTGFYAKYFEDPISIAYIYAADIFAGKVPYIDFNIEYPPLALVFMLIPRLFADTPGGYHLAFSAEMLVLDVLIILLLAAFSRRLGLAGWKTLGIYTLGVLAVGPILTRGFDLAAAFLTLLSLYAFVTGKYKTAWVALAVGVMTKLYPVVLIPLYLIYHWRHLQNRQAVTGMGVFVLAAAGIAAVPLFISAGGFIASFTYHLERPLHMESLYSSVILFVRWLGSEPLYLVFSYGAYNIISPVADFFSSAAVGITGGVLAVVYIFFDRFIRRTAEADYGFMMYAVVTLLVFVVFNKVLSPQFLIWLLPLTALVQRDGRLPWLLFVFICTLTALIYPNAYGGLLDGDPLLISALLLRNTTLVLLLFLMGRQAMVTGNVTPGTANLLA